MYLLSSLLLPTVKGMKVRGSSQVTEVSASPVSTWRRTAGGDAENPGGGRMGKAWHQPRLHPERDPGALVFERRNACLIHGWYELEECLHNSRDRLVCRTFVLALGRPAHQPADIPLPARTSLTDRCWYYHSKDVPLDFDLEV